MNDQALTIEYAVDQSPAEVFTAFTDPRSWWSENIRGGTREAGDEFDYAYADVHTCRIRLSEVEPDRTVVWHVLENRFDFVSDEQRVGRHRHPLRGLPARRAAAPTCASRTSASSRPTSATTSAPTRGASTSGPACGTW